MIPNKAHIASSGLKRLTAAMLVRVDPTIMAPSCYGHMVTAGHPDLERGRIRALVDALCNRTKAFDQLVMKADFRRIKIGDARSRLIVRLADHFREKGLKPTAAVNYGEDANPSPFVALVVLLAASLPEALQESTQGLPAFSRTVSRTLRNRT